MEVDETTVVEGETSPEPQVTSQEPQKDLLEQVNKLMEKVRSDSLAEMGRVRKAADEAIKRATSEATKVYQELIRQREAEELEAVKEEPDKVAVIRERQTRRQTQAELAEARTELTETKTRLQELSARDAETNREKVTREISERLKVDSARLAKLAKFTDGSAEAIEEIAKEMPKLNPVTPKNPLRPDSSESAGGTPKTKSQIQQDYIGGKINAIQYAEKMRAAGFTP